MHDTDLQLKDVSFKYPDYEWSVKDVQLNAKSTDFMALIGPNGAGKSTLLKIAAGLLNPGNGSVTLNGASIHHKSREEIARMIGYLPQYNVVDNHYKVEEVVALGRFPHTRNLGLLGSGDVRIVEQCMAVTETINLRDRPLKTLSGGERQRVILCSVLAQEPQVLILDEPTSGLDIPHQAMFYKLLSELAQTGLAIVVATHNLNLATLYCRDALLLRNGTVVDQGPVGEIITEEKLIETFGPGIVVKYAVGEENRPIVLPG